MFRGAITRVVSTGVLLTAGFAAGAAAQNPNPSEYEPVLVPVSVFRVPGGHGTVWHTQMYFRNNSDAPVRISNLPVADWLPPVRQTIFLPIGVAPAERPGRYLFVSRSGIDQVQFDLRLFNLADVTASWGTKLPVVRERQLAESVDLINVPTSSDFRSALRIYGPDRFPAGEMVRVDIYSHDERLLASREMTLERFPPYAAISSLTDTFPEIRQADRVRVHVESPGGMTKIWAFVSVVSNTTQNVAIVTPE